MEFLSLAFIGLKYPQCGDSSIHPCIPVHMILYCPLPKGAFLFVLPINSACSLFVECIVRIIIYNNIMS